MRYNHIVVSLVCVLVFMTNSTSASWLKRFKHAFKRLRHQVKYATRDVNCRRCNCKMEQALQHYVEQPIQNQVDDMSIICERGYNILKSKDVDMVYVRADGTDNGFKCLSQDPLKYTSFKVPFKDPDLQKKYDSKAVLGRTVYFTAFRLYQNDAEKHEMDPIFVQHMGLDGYMPYQLLCTSEEDVQCK